MAKKYNKIEDIIAGWEAHWNSKGKREAYQWELVFKNFVDQTLRPAYQKIVEMKGEGQETKEFEEQVKVLLYSFAQVGERYRNTNFAGFTGNELKKQLEIFESILYVNGRVAQIQIEAGAWRSNYSN